MSGSPQSLYESFEKEKQRRAHQAYLCDTDNCEFCFEERKKIYLDEDEHETNLGAC